MSNDLRVMLDVSAVPYGRGVSRYTSNLVQHLAQQPGVKLTLLGYNQGLLGKLRQWFSSLPEGVKTVTWPISTNMVDRLWQSLGWPLPNTRQIDVFHAWDWQVPPLRQTPQVVTIHDLAYQLFPETAHPTVVAHYDRLLKAIENNPKIHVIAVSQTTKQDILKLTSINESRVHVVYEALPEESKLVPDDELLQQVVTEFTRPFILFVGTTEPRKNLKTIIQAWELVKSEFDLVIAGSVGWDEFKVRPGMHVLGYVPDDKLAALYRLAHALVYPSLYEGFGLPILEAYFHGCPVITSNTSAPAEIAGKPALLVDPTNAEAIAEAVLSLEGRDTKARQKRQQDMQAVLSDFGWKKAAQQTIEVYRLAAEDKVTSASGQLDPKVEVNDANTKEGNG